MFQELKGTHAMLGEIINYKKCSDVLKCIFYVFVSKIICLKNLRNKSYFLHGHEYMTNFLHFVQHFLLKMRIKIFMILEHVGKHTW